MMSIRVGSGLLVVLVAVAFGTIALGADSAHPPGGDQGSGNINPMAWEEFQGDLAIWTAVVFLVLLAVLWKFAWGPICSGLEKREQGIADQISEAQQSNQEAKDLLGQYENKLANAKADVREILDKARHEAEQAGNALVDKAKQEAQAEQQRAVEQIDLATIGALKELAQQGSTLAVELAGKILRAELKPEDHAALIEQAVAGFGPKESHQNGTGAN